MSNLKPDKDVKDKHQPKTVRLILLRSFPTSFMISKVYSPESTFSAESTFRLEIIREKEILYFLPDASSTPSLNHLGTSSGVPHTLTSRAAMSPAVTLRASGLSRIFAGSAAGREGRKERSRTCFWLNLQGPALSKKKKNWLRKREL